MKKAIILLIFTPLFFFSGCKKEPDVKKILKYELICAEATSFSIKYAYSDGTYLTADVKGGWNRIIEISNNFSYYLEAYGTSTPCDLEIKVYLDGVQLASEVTTGSYAFAKLQGIASW